MILNKQNLFGWFFLFIVPFFAYGDWLVSYNTGMYILTALLLIFCLTSIQRQYKLESSFFWINPICIGTFFTFLLSAGGISNWFRMGEDGLCLPAEIGPLLSDERNWYNLTMGNACYAAFFTWAGYKSGFGKKILTFLKGFWGGIVKAEISVPKLIFFTIIGYASKWYLFSIGLYGRIISNEYFEAVSGYKTGSQIKILGQLSLLTFTIICIYFFKRKTLIYRLLFIISLVLEIFFAFVYAARGPFLVPFFIIFLTNYYINKKFKLIYIGILVVPLILAFTIVLDFKNYALSADFIRSASPIETVTSFWNYRATLSNEQKSEATKGLEQNLLASSNTLSEASMAIRYKSLDGLDEEDPNPLFNLLLVPFNAFVPKFLQPQNEPPWGYWFKEKVLHHAIGLKYSITLSPIGFLYLAGGTFMVCVGFFLYGFLLRLNYLLLFQNEMQFVLFIIILNDLYNFDSVVSGTLVNILRDLLIFPFILYILFSKTAKLSFK